MSFCMNCGKYLVEPKIEAERRNHKTCTFCQTVHYENPKVLVWCMPHWQNRVVLCRRRIAPAEGLWCPPSGFVEFGESLEQAAVRETFEETGLVLEPSSLELLEVVSVPHMNQVYVGFRSCLEFEPQLAAGQEMSEVKLWSERDLPFPGLAYLDLMRDSAAEFLRGLRTGVFAPARATTVKFSAIRKD